MIKFGLFDEEEQQALLRKSVVFYAAISSKEPFVDFDFKRIDCITNNKIKTGLRPVIRKKENFDFEAAKERVKSLFRSCWY